MSKKTTLPFFSSHTIVFIWIPSSSQSSITVITFQSHVCHRLHWINFDSFSTQQPYIFVLAESNRLASIQHLIFGTAYTCIPNVMCHKKIIFFCILKLLHEVAFACMHLKTLLVRLSLVSGWELKPFMHSRTVRKQKLLHRIFAQFEIRALSAASCPVVPVESLGTIYWLTPDKM